MPLVVSFEAAGLRAVRACRRGCRRAVEGTVAADEGSGGLEAIVVEVGPNSVGG